MKCRQEFGGRLNTHAEPVTADKVTPRRPNDIPPASMFAPAPEMSRMPITDFAGVEFYSDATLPMQFNAPRQSNCGTLLLWTRER